MCGRFNLTNPTDIVQRFGFMDWSDKRIEPRFNIAPSQEILTIVQLPLEQPNAQMAIWGLKPFWLEKGKAPPINARAEALSSSAMLRDAQRCLIPATGFYEWRRPTRQPMHIRLRNGEPFAFAGLWLPPGKHGGLPTAAILTTKPNDLVATIHNRMPVILRPEDELSWLDPGMSQLDAKQLLKPFPDEAMEAYPVRPLVNSWENEGPQLVEPLSGQAGQPEQMALPISPELPAGRRRSLSSSERRRSG
jgi:putative SOS response-associated peptidase YedK